jgi:hypothetical protein
MSWAKKMFDPYNIVASLLFGGIGMVAFYYGKKQVLWQPIVLGLALMIYPWFVGGKVWLNWTIGVALTVLLWFFHDD